MADRPKGFGMTAELADKKAAKYDPASDLQVRKWISEVVGDPTIVHQELSESKFQEEFGDGKTLCKLINCLVPGSVPKVNESKMAFKMMENTGCFLEACEKYGVPKSDIFQTVDLYEAQNIPQVLNGIVALGRKAQAKGFAGPALGPKEATECHREFTEETLQEGKKVIGLQMGSNKGASQAGTTAYGDTRQIMPKI